MQFPIYISLFLLSATTFFASYHRGPTFLTQIALPSQVLAKASQDRQPAISLGGKIAIPTGSTIVLLDCESKLILWEAKGLHGGRCVTTVPTGGFLVGEGKSIARLNEKGEVLSRASATFKSTSDVKMLESGRILVSDGIAGTVAEMDWSGNVTWSLNGLHHPSEAVRLENGDTLVADGTAELKQFNAAGKLVGTIRLQRWAASVQRLSGGRTIVGEREAVELLDSAGQVIWSQPSVGRVVGVQQLSGGEFLITEFDANRITVLDAEGKAIWEFFVKNPRRAIYLP